MKHSFVRNFLNEIGNALFLVVFFFVVLLFYAGFALCYPICKLFSKDK